MKANLQFQAKILNTGTLSEKLGYVYIVIPNNIANLLNPDHKKAFRVKGKIDNIEIKQHSCMPIGNGEYALTLSKSLRQKLNKKIDDLIHLHLLRDDDELQADADFIICLEDSPQAKIFYNSLSRAHKHYFLYWIKNTKNLDTKSKRIAQSIQALEQNLTYPEMIKMQK